MRRPERHLTAHRSPPRIRPALPVRPATAANVGIGGSDDQLPREQPRPIRRLPDGLAPSAGSRERGGPVTALRSHSAARRSPQRRTAPTCGAGHPGSDVQCRGR